MGGNQYSRSVPRKCPRKRVSGGIFSLESPEKALIDNNRIFMDSETIGLIAGITSLFAEVIAILGMISRNNMGKSAFSVPLLNMVPKAAYWFMMSSASWVLLVIGLYLFGDEVILGHHFWQEEQLVGLMMIPPAGLALLMSLKGLLGELNVRGDN